MKRLLCVVVLVLLYSVGQTAEIDKQVEQAFTHLSKMYSEKYPVKDVKTGLAVLPFRENSSLAKSKELGKTLRDIMERIIVKSSQIFYLVERENLKEILEEIALSQTGVIDEDQIVTSRNLVGAGALITGTISDLKDKFDISLRIINVSSGTVVAVEKIQVEQNELVQKNEILALETISRFGLGINFQWSNAYIKSPEDYFLHFTDVYVNYRPFLWLNFKLGGTAMVFNILASEADADAVYPKLNTHANPLITNLDYDGGNLSVVSPFVGLEINHMFSQKFSVSAGASFIFGKADLTQQYSNGVFFDDDDGLVHPMKTFRIEQELRDIWLVRLESKSQYFISPRMTLSLYLAYLVGPDLYVERSVVNDDYREFPHEGDPAPLEFRNKYFEMSTTLLGNGSDVEDISFSNGFAIGVGFNFYF